MLAFLRFLYWLSFCCFITFNVVCFGLLWVCEIVMGFIILCVFVFWLIGRLDGSVMVFRYNLRGMREWIFG